MTSKQIRQSFLDFFAGKEHKIVPSAPVIPHGDPTLLFTNAGMNQFKDVFLGTGRRDYSRAADTQKCIRVSGKHNDLEEVGVDTYHHTLFEMLGNWSFGDYYKREAIDWAWELLTNVWKLDPTRLHATVYRTDDEAYELWQKHLPLDHIHRFDEKDNFWEMGESGPCGPCSEVHYDRTPDLSGAKLVNAGVPEVIEIWNLVFIQYNRRQDGTLEDLAAKHVDTGMGFERIVAVIQGHDSNYDSDVFMPLINEISRIANVPYTKKMDKKEDIAMRVIADHIRTLSFAIADGALPGNEGRGYVLRRILRRGLRFARNLGIREPILYKLLPTLIDSMGEVFPELVQQKNTIERVIKGEEESFLQTLDRGLEIFDSIKNKLVEEGKTEVSGEDAFQLYDTFGFPRDLTELLARENGLTVDGAGFEAAMAEQRARSRASRKVHAQEAEMPLIDATTEFTGYKELASNAKVVFAKENMLVLDRTPFYAESGGQSNDAGTLTIAGIKYDVVDLRKMGGSVIHYLDREPEAEVGTEVLAEVSETVRRAIMRNHSATHLMHQALFDVLGSHVKQAGSLVSADYLRFDFNHFEKVSAEDLAKVEAIVNEKILAGIDVQVREMPLEEAQKSGRFKMFFGDKYGDTVRCVTMDDKFSNELCGGTHVGNTSEICLFKITQESSISAGVRRIEAVTGAGVLDFIAKQAKKIDDEKQNNEDLKTKIHSLEKEISALKTANVGSEIAAWIADAARIDAIRVAARQIEAESLDQMRTIGENLRNEFGTNGIGLVAAIIDEKVQLVCVSTDDLVKQYPAGKLVGECAKRLGGGGGGKPHLATAGGRDTAALPQLLSDFVDIVKSFSK